MLRYATIEEAWQRSTPPIRRTYPADQGQHTTLPEILDPPAEAPVEYAEYDRLEGQRPDVLPDHVPQSAPVTVTEIVRPGECVETGMYDVMLYAISGIVLVLILEQFVQMGIKMGP
jgi:hypothetical protein